MRILVIVPLPMGEEGLRLRQAQAPAAKLKGGTELVYRAVAIGPKSLQGAHDLAIMDMAVLEAGIGAAAEGFDAICVDSMTDSGVAALRSVLKIPVIGAGRAAFMTALMLGSKFSIMVMYEPWIPIQWKTLKDYGLLDRLASIRSIDVPPSYGSNGGVATSREEEGILPLLLDAAKRAIAEDGAEAIIMGSTTMYRAVDHVAGRISAPVLPAGPLSYRYAEMLVDLGLTHFNDGNTVSPSPLPGMLARMVAAAGQAD